MNDIAGNTIPDRNWQLYLMLPDASFYPAFNGTDQRGLVAVVDALTRPDVGGVNEIRIALGPARVKPV